MIYRGHKITSTDRPVGLGVYAPCFALNEGDGPDEQLFDTLDEAKDAVDAIEDAQ